MNAYSHSRCRRKPQICLKLAFSIDADAGRRGRLGDAGVAGLVLTAQAELNAHFLGV